MEQWLGVGNGIMEGEEEDEEGAFGHIRQKLMRDELTLRGCLLEHTCKK